MRKKVLATVALLTIVLSLLPAGYAQAAVGMSPTQGVVGLEVTISNLTSGISYNIKWDDVSIKQGTTESTGNTSFFVPASYGGEHTVKVENPTGTQIFSGAFTVSPNISIDPSSGVAGTTINVVGRGFGVSEKNIAVTYDGTNVSSSILADEHGSWSSTFVSPPSARGSHSVDASGDVTKGSDVADKKFSVSPQVKMDPVAGGVGTLVNFTATGFASAEGGIKILYSSKEVRAGITAEVNGSWSTTVAIPNSTRGSHIINVLGDTTLQKEIPDMIFTVAPAVSISPDTGFAEDTITVKGSGFANNESSVELTMDGKAILRNIMADDSGFWTASFKMPEAVNGPHTISADGRVTPATDVTAATFTMQPLITVVPKAGFVKDELRVTGTGFSPSKDYSLSFADAPAASGTTNDTGSLQAVFKAPGGKSGAITIKVTDLKNITASTTFTIDTTPPDVPQIASPKDGATVGFMGDTKVVFKWTTVTSRNGVSYEIEVSDQSNFAKKLVAHAKLVEPMYTLTEAEALPNGEYFWHVRAVDGAGNTSEWSPTASLKVGFMTPTTLIIIGVGIVALLIIVAILNRLSHHRKKKKVHHTTDWE